MFQPYKKPFRDSIHKINFDEIHREFLMSQLIVWVGNLWSLLGRFTVYLTYVF